MKNILLFLVPSLVYCEDVQLRYDDVCFGQCTVASGMTSFVSELPNGQTISVDFHDGFFHLKNLDGKVKHFLSGTDTYAELKKELNDLPQDKSETESNKLLEIMQSTDLSQKNNRQAYQQKIFRLEKQNSWCKKNDSLKLKDCANILENYQSNKEQLESRLKSDILEHQQCLKKTPTANIASKILPLTKRILPHYKGGVEKLSIDGPYCNIATGLTSAILDDLGFVRGQDYLFQSGASHVYLTLPKENKIIDPTFAQFFKKNSLAYQMIMQNSGFVGTPKYLFDFLYEHRRDLSHCSDDQKGCRDNFYANKLKEIKANSNPVEARAALEKLFKDLFYGDNWNPEKKYLIDTAVATSDYFGKNRETVINSHRPELKKMAEELQAFQCIDKNIAEKMNCINYENEKIKNETSIPELEPIARTVEIINVHKINGLIK